MVLCWWCGVRRGDLLAPALVNTTVIVLRGAVLLQWALVEGNCRSSQG